MKRLTALTLAVMWMLTIAAPPVATAAETTSTTPTEECVDGDGAALLAAGMASAGCDPMTEGVATIIFPDGTVGEMPIECPFTGEVVVKPRPDGGADVFCDYGLCGLEEI